MKKIMTAFTALALGCTAVFLQGCLKDSYERTYTYTYYKPVYKTSAQVRANIQSNAPKEIERPGKLYILGQYIFLNEIDKGIHIIDNANPAQPRNIGFIDIPGNMDLAVKGNTLYADLYTDLVAIDITNPLHAVLKKTVEGVFPNRAYYNYFSPDTSLIIASWEKRDTTVKEGVQIGGWFRREVFMSYSADASVGGGPKSVSPYGVGGSTARFTITGRRLYTVSTQELSVFNITNPTEPVVTSAKSIGWNIETIYPFMNQLFIGSQNGMFVFNISNPDNPVEKGRFAHVQSCDPVISDGQYAYVTLRTGTACWGTANQLDILKLNDFLDPTLVKSYGQKNPSGLSKDGNILFICDGSEGLKIYDASDVSNLRLLQIVDNIEPHDVIAMNGVALVVAKGGLYQYDYSNPSKPGLLSKISIKE